jgi:hypothetical protein
MKTVHGILLLTIFALLCALHILKSVENFPSRKGSGQGVSVDLSITTQTSATSKLNAQGVKSDLEWINNRTAIGFDCRIKQKPEDEKYVGGWRDLAKNAYGEVSKAITRCSGDVRDAKSWLQWFQAQIDQGIQCEVEQNTTSSKAIESIRDIAKSSFDNINTYLDQCSGK